MMRRSTLVQILALACGVGLVAVAASNMGPINAGRAKLNMMGSASPLENAPPEYAFAVQALGAFRGLVVDLAFIRAESYKEQGRYFDAAQLAKWICALQPHFVSVWEFAAWNMAWNISVTTYTPEERWNWVYAGVKLLRDQGIPMNPRAVNLYKQLAWTFNNKMGEITDDFHYTYKCNWAWRMHVLLGPRPEPMTALSPEALANLGEDQSAQDELAKVAREAFIQNEETRAKAARARGETYTVRTPEQALPDVESETSVETELLREAVYDYIRKIDETPRKLEDLYAAFPEARRMAADLRPLGIVISEEELTEDEYWRPGGLAFALFAPYRKLTEPQALLAQLTHEQEVERGEAEQMRRIDQVLGVRAGNPAGQALVRWLQRKVLSDVYSMDTGHMLSVVQEFGPVDWRSVDAQALYWVTEGLIASGETANDLHTDKMNTARIMLHSLRNLFLRDRIVFEPWPPAIYLSYLNLSYDPCFIEAMNQAYLKYGPLFDPKGPEWGKIQGAGMTYKVGHINHMNEAIRLLYLSGREKDAARYYRELQDLYPTNEQGVINPEFQKTLRDYVMDDFLQSTTDNPGLREIRLALNGLFYNAYQELLAGDVQRYARIVQRARELYTDYMKDKENYLSERMRLKSFADEQIDAFGLWMSQPVPTPRATIDKARLWRAAPLFLRQGVYDAVQPQLEAECKEWGFDPQEAFAEPKGMEDYRKAHPDRAKPAKPDDTETLPQNLNT